MKHFASDLPALPCQRDDERSAVDFSHMPRHEASIDESVDDARQRGSFMRQPFVEIRHRCGSCRREHREDVGFALRQRAVAKGCHIQSDSVSRAMNWRNQTEQEGASRRWAARDIIHCFPARPV
jgi:hypothetical protein